MKLNIKRNLKKKKLIVKRLTTSFSTFTHHRHETRKTRTRKKESRLGKLNYRKTAINAVFERLFAI